METIPSHIVANEMNNTPVDSNSADVEIKEAADTGLEYLSDGEQPAMKQAGKLRLESAVRSDVGAVRERNEDACLLYSFDSDGHDPLLPFGLYILADGMGGYDGGDRASKTATRAAAQYLLQRIYLPLLKGEPHPGQASIEQTLRESVLSAHEAVHPPDYSGNGGTTLTLALVLGRQLHLAHVGDSRAYCLVNGDLQALTKDHSLVQRLQDEGELTVEEAENFQYRNILLRALGQEEELEVDTYFHQLPARGKLLLCSDGLCGQISDKEILQIMIQTLAPGQIADQLISAALQAGGWDNISVIVVEFEA